MSDYRVSLTLRSKNAKTGPIPVSMTTAATCPGSCPFNHGNAGGCYAASGPLSWGWAKVTKGALGTDWATFCAQVAALPEGQLWRHNQAGDLPGIGDAIDTRALSELVNANRGRRGFTYTHKPMTGQNAVAVHKANARGFVVNLSANDLGHADALAETGAGPVVVVLPSDQTANTRTPAGRPVVICPAYRSDDVTCATCGLCAKGDRKSIVGFPAHGSGARKVSAVARGVPAVCER